MNQLTSNNRLNTILRVPALLIALTSGIGWAQVATAPVIRGVVVSTSVTPNQMTITGSLFGTVPPAVTLDGLPVTPLSFTDTVIVAPVPVSVVPGSYALVVTNGVNHLTGTSVATIGAVGPAGPSGSAGPVGPMGPQGLAGLTGANGVSGSSGYSVQTRTSNVYGQNNRFYTVDGVPLFVIPGFNPADTSPQVLSVQAYCPSGKQPLGGGYYLPVTTTTVPKYGSLYGPVFSVPQYSWPSLTVLSSAPAGAGWNVVWGAPQGTLAAFSVSLTTYVICSTVLP